MRKIRYYDETTIESNPRYCYYPVPIATGFTYSTKALRKREEKRQKYRGLKHIKLCEKAECVPSDEYCDLYNKNRSKELEKQKCKHDAEAASIPREYAKNYDIDFAGRQYDSLFIEECINEHLESAPQAYFTQFHHKHWQAIIVYKQYKCRCLLCGKVQYVNCDAFGINPPEKYGIHAYDGYWSDVYCECRKKKNKGLSSFHWIVCKLLFESNCNYKVEYSFDDLYGNRQTNLLRFDFAVFDNAESIKCLIECQGEQHYRAIDDLGGMRAYEEQANNDALKRAYCIEKGIKLIEIPFKEKRIDSVQEILKSNGIIPEDYDYAGN